MSEIKNPTFNNREAQQIWLKYLARVESLCGLLNVRQKSDILMELRAHLFESYIQIKLDDEVEGINSAIEKLGQPEEFIPLWVEDRLLEEAVPGASVSSLYKLIKVNAVKGSKQFIISMLIGFGYLLSFFFFIMAILKIFYPENVGLYLSDNNIPFMGYLDAAGFTEILGNAFIPVALVITVILQFLLNKVVQKQFRNK